MLLSLLAVLARFSFLHSLSIFTCVSMSSSSLDDVYFCSFISRFFERLKTFSRLAYTWAYTSSMKNNGLMHGGKRVHSEVHSIMTMRGYGS